MIQGAIFDLDGTLLDSMIVWETLAQDYLSGRGLACPSDIREKVERTNLLGAAQILREECGIALSAEQIVSELSQVLTRSYETKTTLKRGVREFLHFLHKRKVPMCIATGSDRTAALAAIRHHGIDRYFVDVLSCDDIGSSKAQPEIFRRAAALLGSEKNKTVVFEDALFAARTAKLDGFLLAAVYDPYEKRQAKLKELADVCIEEMSESSGFRDWTETV